MATPDTSKDAYDWVRVQGKDVSDRDFILAHLVKAGPATRRQLGKRLGIETKFIGPRVSELRRDGLVEHGEKTTNEDTGRQAYLVKPTEHARPYLRGEYEPEPEQRSPKQLRRQLVRDFQALEESDGKLWATTEDSKQALDDVRETYLELKEADGRL